MIASTCPRVPAPVVMSAESPPWGFALRLAQAQLTVTLTVTLTE